MPWSPVVADIRTSLIAYLEQQGFAKDRLGFNSVFLNGYTGGHHAIGPHADDEYDLVPGSLIASVSLGADRDMCFEPKASGTATGCVLPLRSGSVVTMGGDTQNNWLHSVPPGKGERINLTFRVVREPSLTSGEFEVIECIDDEPEVLDFDIEELEWELVDDDDEDNLVDAVDDIDAWGAEEHLDETSLETKSRAPWSFAEKCVRGFCGFFVLVMHCFCTSCSLCALVVQQASDIAVFLCRSTPVRFVIGSTLVLSSTEGEACSMPVRAHADGNGADDFGLAETAWDWDDN